MTEMLKNGLLVKEKEAKYRTNNLSRQHGYAYTEKPA